MVSPLALDFKEANIIQIEYIKYRNGGYVKVGKSVI